MAVRSRQLSACRRGNLPVVEARGNDRLGELGPLPGGHHGLSREQILDSQRERLLAAIVQVVADRGYRATTLAEVGKQASVSNRH